MHWKPLLVALLMLIAVAGGGAATVDPSRSVPADADPILDSDKASVAWIQGSTVQGETIHPRLQERLDESAPDHWLRTIVQFESREAVDQNTMRSLGGAVYYEMNAIPALFVAATPESIRLIADFPGVRLVEYAEEVTYDLDSAVHTGRAYQLWGAPNPGVTSENGTRIDGIGVGVAVVDTGLYATHRDIQVGKTTARNLLPVGLPVTQPDQPSVAATPLVWVDSPHSDGPIGHGTHVGGIVAGSGELSDGRYQGSAPGANLYGFGHPLFIGAGPGQYTASIWYAVAAWDWIYENGHDQDPPIRVITNSWGYSHGPCDVDLTISQVQQKLIMERDIVMTFSVGNSGGDGSQAQGRNQARCPWQGHLGVASMDDQGERNRDGPLSGFSARGDIDDPATWPHITAPGSNIMAANGMTGPALCSVQPLLGLDTSDCYISFSGTSMSTPYVAGVVALVLQANPELKPADVQYIIQKTAYKFGEGHELDDREVVYHQDPNGDYRHHGSHYAHGHGLVDAEAAVAFAMEYDPADHPVVYGFDETPAPLWEYALMDNQTTQGGPAVTEESPLPALLVLVPVTVALIAAARVRRD